MPRKLYFTTMSACKSKNSLTKTETQTKIVLLLGILLGMMRKTKNESVWEVVTAREVRESKTH